MCACVAGPVSLANVSRHLSLPPLSVPLNKPWAAVFLTTCFGTSCPDVSAAVQTVFCAAASESAVRASAQTLPTVDTAMSFRFMSPPVDGTSLAQYSSLPGRRFAPTAVGPPRRRAEGWRTFVANVTARNAPGLQTPALQRSGLCHRVHRHGLIA